MSRRRLILNGAAVSSAGIAALRMRYRGNNGADRLYVAQLRGCDGAGSAESAAADGRVDCFALSHRLTLTEVPPCRGPTSRSVNGSAIQLEQTAFKDRLTLIAWNWGTMLK